MPLYKKERFSHRKEFLMSDIKFTKLSNASLPDNEKYQNYLSDKTKNILGDKDSISFNDLTANSVFAKEYEKMSAEEKEKVRQIVTLAGNMNQVTEKELKVLYTFLDAKLTEDGKSFEFDAEISLGEKSGLSEATFSEINRIYDNTLTKNELSAFKLAQSKLQTFNLYNKDGSINNEEAIKVLQFLKSMPNLKNLSLTNAKLLGEALGDGVLGISIAPDGGPIEIIFDDDLKTIASYDPSVSRFRVSSHENVNGVEYSLEGKKIENEKIEQPKDANGKYVYGDLDGNGKVSAADFYGNQAVIKFVTNNQWYGKNWSDVGQALNLLMQNISADKEESDSLKSILNTLVEKADSNNHSEVTSILTAIRNESVNRNISTEERDNLLRTLFGNDTNGQPRFVRYDTLRDGGTTEITLSDGTFIVKNLNADSPREHRGKFTYTNPDGTKEYFDDEGIPTEKFEL